MVCLVLFCDVDFVVAFTWVCIDDVVVAVVVVGWLVRVYVLSGWLWWVWVVLFCGLRAEFVFCLAYVAVLVVVIGSGLGLFGLLLVIC